MIRGNSLKIRGNLCSKRSEVMAKKILMIDDEKDLVDTLSFRLQAHGFDVISASDGPRGIEKAKADKPDLIILDLMMPGMDGYEVVKRLKADNATTNVPIIILTAAVSPELTQKVCNIHAADCITKPFEPRDLLEKVKKALSKSNQ